MSFISAAANGAVPYITGRFFDALIALERGAEASGVGAAGWGVLLLLWALIQIVAHAVDWIIDRREREATIRVETGTQSRGFLHLLDLPISFFKSTNIHGVFQTLGSSSWRIAAIGHIAVKFGPQFLSMLIGLGLTASIDLTLAGILLAGVATYILFLVRMLRGIAPESEHAHKIWNEGFERSAEAVANVETVKQANAEQYEKDATHARFDGGIVPAWERMERHWSNVSFAERIIVFVTQLAIFLISAGMVSRGALSVGELITVNG
jgi:ABC-type multidrug transport system fused ATPase/permease subunit